MYHSTTTTVCLYCGKDIARKRWGAKFCDNACRQAAYRKRRAVAKAAKDALRRKRNKKAAARRKAKTKKK